MNEWDPILVNEAYRKWVLSKINECCFVLLTRGCGRWARGKRMGFTPAPAALHRNWTRVPRILSFSRWLFLSGSLFPPLFFRFWNQTSPRCETRLFISQKSEIGHNEVCLFSDFGSGRRPVSQKRGKYPKKTLLRDFWWFILHLSLVVKSAALKNLLSTGHQFDSGRKHVNSDSHGFEQIDPKESFLNHWFQ